MEGAKRQCTSHDLRAEGNIWDEVTVEPPCLGKISSCSAEVDNPLHPLRNFLILRLICIHMDATELKVCRLVNKRWNLCATPTLLSKVTVGIDAEDDEKLADLEAWMNSLEISLENEKATPTPSSSKAKSAEGGSHVYQPFRHYFVEKITHKSYSKIKRILGRHVESIKIAHRWNDYSDLFLEDYEDLLLNQCPNLKELSITATEHFTRASKFLLSNSNKVNIPLKLERLTVEGDVCPAVGFWRIIKRSPNLTSLTLRCVISEEFWNPDPIKKTMNKRMQNLQRLEVKVYGNESISQRSGFYFLEQNWSLKSLTYECYNLTDGIMHDCAIHVSRTLEELNINLFNKKCDPWPADKGKDWVLPPNLTKLKRFTLEIDDHCEGPIFCRTLVASLFLPCLTTLQMNNYEDEDCNEHDWPDGLFVRILRETIEYMLELDESLNIPPRTSLKQLKLPPKFQDITSISPLAHYYPCLSEVELDRPHPAVLTEIFSHWTHLKRLTVTLMDFVGLSRSWSTVLSGLQVLIDDNKDECVKFQRTKPGLSDLKNLTFLDITLTPCILSNQANQIKFPLNDCVIDELIKLHALQHIFVKGHEFTTEAMFRLRNSVLPFCYINLLK